MVILEVRNLNDVLRYELTTLFTDDFFTIGLLDTDKAMQAFFDGCHSAGPEACPFYASSPSEIAANLEAIYTSLRSQPVPVFAGDSFGVITYDFLRAVVFTAIDAPYSLFQTLASGLADLFNGSGTQLFEMFVTWAYFNFCCVLTIGS